MWARYLPALILTTRSKKDDMSDDKSDEKEDMPVMSVST